MAPLAWCQVVSGTVGMIDVYIVGAVAVAQIGIGRHEETFLLRSIVESPDAVPEVIVVGLHPEGDGGTVVERQAIVGIGHLGIAVAVFRGGRELMKHAAIADAALLQLGFLGWRGATQVGSLLGIENVHHWRCVEVVISQHATLIIHSRNGVLLGHDIVGLLPVIVATGLERRQLHVGILGQSGRIVAAFAGDDVGLGRCPLQINSWEEGHVVKVDAARNATRAGHGNRLRVHLTSQLVLLANLVAPDRNTRRIQCREAEGLDVGRLHLLLGEHTEVNDAADGQMDVGGAVYKLPLAFGSATDGAVVAQFNLHG